MDFVSKAIANQVDKVNESLRLFQKPKTIDNPQINIVPQVSTNVPRETFQDTKKPESFELIPDSEKPFFHLKETQKQTKIDESSAEYYADELNKSFSVFNEQQKKNISKNINQYVKPDMDYSEKTDVMKNLMLIEQYNTLPKTVRDTIKTYAETKKLGINEVKELYAQAITMQTKDKVDVLIDFLKSDKDNQTIMMKDMKEIYLNIAPDALPEEKKSLVVEKIEKIRDDLKTRQNLAEKNEKFASIIESSDAVKSLVGFTPDEFAALLGDPNAKPEGFQLEKIKTGEYANPVTLGKDLFKESLKAGGSALWAVYGMIQRDAQYGTGMALKLKSMYEEFIDNDKDAAEAYGALSKQVIDAAKEDTTFGFFSLSPPRKSFDSYDMFDVLIGRYEEPKQLSYLDAIGFNPVKTATDLTKTYFQNKYLEESFKKENKLSTLELYKRYAHNTMVTTWGFLGDAVLSPLSLFTAPMKIAGSEAKTIKTAVVKAPTVEIFKDRILASTRLIEQGVKKQMTEIAGGIGYEDIKKALKNADDLVFDAKKMTEAEFLQKKSLMDIAGVSPEQIIKIRDLGKEYNKLSSVRDQILQANMKLQQSRKMNAPMMLEEQQMLVSQIVNLSDEYNQIAINIAEQAKIPLPNALKDSAKLYKQTANNMDAIVVSGMARMSKSGLELMKQYKSNVGALDTIGNFNAEVKLAIDAMKDPKLFDEGITWFGIEIPGTRKIITGLKEARTKMGLFTRFPTGDEASERLISKYVLEHEGHKQATELFIRQSSKDLTEAELVRVSFAIETGMIDQLPPKLKVAAMQGQDSFNAAYKHAEEATKEALQLWKKRGVSDDVIGGFEDIKKFGKVTEDRKVRWLKSGMTTDQIAKTENDLLRLDLAGNYIEDYQTMIYKDKTKLHQIKELAQDQRKTGVRKASPIYDRLDVGLMDEYSRTRMFKDRKQAMAVYSDDVAKWYNEKIYPKELKQYNIAKKSLEKSGDIKGAMNLMKPQKMVKENVSGFINKTVDDFVMSGEQKYLDLIEGMNKVGVNVELRLDNIMRSRLNSANNALLRRRLNIDLAKNFGINDTMQNYFKDKMFVTAASEEFHGVKIPEGIKRALIDLDTPDKKTMLRMEMDARAYWSSSFQGLDYQQKIGFKRMFLKQLHYQFLDKLDTVNGWFASMVTTIHPQFHMRNAYSNTIMNFWDKGARAFDPVLAKKTLNLVSNINTKGYGRNILFKNKFDKVVTGEEMLTMMRESGVLSGVKNKAGMASDEMALYRRFFETNPLNKAGQGIEDFYRAQNFIISWEQGYSIADAAMNSQRALINYQNTTKFQKEFINRTMPWMTFFKENFKNSMRTLIKYPERVFASTRVSAHLSGGNIENKSDISQATTQYNRAPIFSDEYYDPATGKMVVMQTTRTNNPFEDMFRFTGVMRKAYEGLAYLSENQSELASGKFQEAFKESGDLLYPVHKIGIAFADMLFGGKIIQNEKINPVFEKYLSKVPMGYRKMLGIDIDRDKKTGKFFLELDAVANIMFEMTGAGRTLYQMGVIDDEQYSAIEAVDKLIGVFGRKKYDLDEAKKIKMQVTAKQVENASNIIRKSLKDINIDYVYEEKFQEQVNKNNPNPNYGNRVDGTKKGKGFLGELKRPDGSVSTELSIEVTIDGKKTLIPSLVPTLTKSEIDYLLNGGKMTQSISRKAYDHAIERKKKGLSPFAD